MTPSPVGAAWRVLKAGWRWYHQHYNKQKLMSVVGVGLPIVHRLF
jgi:hypothetical protein